MNALEAVQLELKSIRTAAIDALTGIEEIFSAEMDEKYEIVACEILMLSVAC